MSLSIGSWALEHELVATSLSTGGHKLQSSVTDKA